VRRRWLWLLPFLLLLGGIVGWWRYARWREHRFDPVILSAAQRYGVEPALVKAVVWRESRFKPKARGSRQEIGLMQIRAAAASDWARTEKIRGFLPEHLLDPATNTLAGAWYLARLLRRYQRADRPIHYALADYNAGRSNVLRWTKGNGGTNSVEFLAQMDFPGTRKYVLAVAKRYQQYRGDFPAKKP
jgi:soluble lytic murein transglycosylase